MDRPIDAPSMEVLRGKTKPGSPILGLRFQPDETSPQTEFLPILLGESVDVERGRSRRPKYIIREAKVVWADGVNTAHSLMRAGATIIAPATGGRYVGLAVVLPDVVYTEHCSGLACRDCHLWDPCLAGGLPFGWYVNVTVEAFHLSKKFNTAEEDYSPVFKDGSRATTLTVHGASLPREVLSFNKDSFLPQTWKSTMELAAKEQDPTDNEE